jgi:universal stress protein A
MAGPYRRILLIVDLSEDSRAIGARAQALAGACGASLSLLHVVEYVPVEPLGETLLPAVEMEAELVRRAEDRLATLARELGLEAAPRRVATGNTLREILDAAESEHVDLIVTGSRERHGLANLLNLTEDAILHGAPCDVLAVRVR